MSVIKTPEEITILREAGRRLAVVLGEVEKAVAPGVSTRELNDLAERLIREGGDEPAFLGYQPEGASYPYPATLCVSVNDEVVHGIPGDLVLRDGDIIGIDLGLKHRGMYVDMARTVPVGHISKGTQKLIDVTRTALSVAIKEVCPGKTTGDIGFAVEQYVAKNGFFVVEELGGHGVGHMVHEDPYIPNFGKQGDGDVIREGMVLALEPIVNEKSNVIRFKDDGYTVVTKKGNLSAHFEDTIVVLKNGAEVITKK